jgi:PKD repeat protein
LTVSAGSSGNQAPTITSGPTATPNPTHEGNTIAFTVAATDPEGDALTYLWDFGDGVTATGAYVEYAYSTAGTYTAGITVSDGLQAATASVLVVVQESGSNGAPVISSGPQATPNPVKTGNKVLLVAAAISSSEGKPLLTWDFGDGHNGAGGNVLHTYSTAGIYVATVTATDAAGRTSSASTLVEVAETGSSSDDLTVSKTAISLNFKKADSDAVTLSGLLRIDEDFVPEDLELAMDLGGIEQTFVLDAKGRDRTSKTEKFQLTVRYRKGVLVTGLTKYALQLRKGNFQDILESFGFVNETIKGETLSLPVVISTPATIYIGTLEGTYKAKMDSSGKYAARAK